MNYTELHFSLLPDLSIAAAIALTIIGALGIIGSLAVMLVIFTSKSLMCEPVML